MATEKAKLDIKYFLVAQVTPLNKEDWEDEKNEVSSLRAEAFCTVERPFTPATAIDTVKEMRYKVGGFCCIGSKPFSAKVTFNREQYSPGDQVKVKVSCDNTLCKKDVDKFKIKLKMLVVGHATNGSCLPTKTHNVVLDARYKDLCKKGEKFERTLEGIIP